MESISHENQKRWPSILGFSLHRHGLVLTASSKEECRATTKSSTKYKGICPREPVTSHLVPGGGVSCTVSLRSCHFYLDTELYVELHLKVGSQGSETDNDKTRMREMKLKLKLEGCCPDQAWRLVSRVGGRRFGAWKAGEDRGSNT